MKPITITIYIICSCLILGVTGYAQKTNVYTAENEVSSDNYNPSEYRIWGNYHNEKEGANELDAWQLPSFYYNMLKPQLKINIRGKRKELFHLPHCQEVWP